MLSRANNFQHLSEDIVNRAGRRGGTFLHTSRTRLRADQVIAGASSDLVVEAATQTAVPS